MFENRFYSKVLVACEFSGIVRDAFRFRGWDARSCDLLESEKPGQHHTGDVRDLVIAHPPCRHLAASGARQFKYKRREQAEALEFVRHLLNAPIPRIALENPIGVISTSIRKPDQKRTRSRTYTGIADAMARQRTGAIKGESNVRE